ncbi:hypothetical protein I4U23_019809 [Adineta vaga]|nr:hypothetical protein I4U23_019809 [Adineta vaga]
MSTSFIASLLDAYRAVIVYSGIPILILGLIGNCLNTIVFLSLRTFRQNSCAFYLTVMSMVNIVQLLTGLLTRIMITGFNIDWTQSSLIYCKFRTFCFQLTSAMSFTCICLATIDQYCATCSRLQWQQFSRINLARRLLILIIICLFIEQIPCMIYYEHNQLISTGKVICTITNLSFIQFNTYFNYLILGNILPYLITISFGILAYRNVKKLAHRTIPLVRRELDKQLTSIVLIQVIFNFFFVFPSFIMYIIASYGHIQEPIVVAQINLAYAITLCLYFVYFTCPFYIYITVSERFRRQLVFVLFKTYQKRFQRQQQRIVPDQTNPRPKSINMNSILIKQ